MADIRITADITQVARLGDSFGRAAVTGLRRVLERGEELLKREAPKVTGNLRQGVS